MHGDREDLFFLTPSPQDCRLWRSLNKARLWNTPLCYGRGFGSQFYFIDLFASIMPCCCIQCIIIQCLFVFIRIQNDFFLRSAIMLSCILHLSSSMQNCHQTMHCCILYSAIPSSFWHYCFYNTNCNYASRWCSDYAPRRITTVETIPPFENESRKKE